jgi:Protein of unknown function, DUF547
VTQTRYFKIFVALLIFANCKNESAKTVEKSANSTNFEADSTSLTEKSPVSTPNFTKKNPSTIVQTAPESRKAVETTKSILAQKPVTQPQQVEKTADLIQNNPKTTENVTISATTATETKPNQTINYDDWEAILQKFVSKTGQVDYQGLKANRTDFDAFLQRIAENPPENEWSRAEKMAFWINTYNAFTIALILENYPLKKIIDLDGGKPWDIRRITIGTNKYSLNQIENDILRPKFKDARIHFAVNCAAKSCPPLLNRAFRAEKLDAQLAERTRDFLKNRKFNQFSTETANVSKIFDWYGVDFENLILFFNKYTVEKLSATTNIQFNEYDWNLNE